MIFKQSESPSGNLMTRTGRFHKALKTNHDNSYTEKVLFILDSEHIHGSVTRSRYARTK